ncbi:hypothetical protein CC79DRAFT_1151117 [Sarocladium strictum]
MPLAGRVDWYVSSTSTRIFPRPRRISTFLYCFLKWWIPATGSTFLGLAANCLQPLATGRPLVRHCDHPLSPPLSSTVNNTRQCPSAASTLAPFFSNKHHLSLRQIYRSIHRSAGLIVLQHSIMVKRTL